MTSLLDLALLSLPFLGGAAATVTLHRWIGGDGTAARRRAPLPDRTADWADPELPSRPYAVR